MIRGAATILGLGWLLVACGSDGGTATTTPDEDGGPRGSGGKEASGGALSETGGTTSRAGAGGAAGCGDCDAGEAGGSAIDSGAPDSGRRGAGGAQTVDAGPDGYAPPPDFCEIPRRTAGEKPRGGLDCGDVCKWQPDTAPQGFSSLECPNVESCGADEVPTFSAPLDWWLFLGVPAAKCNRDFISGTKNVSASFKVGADVCTKFTSSDTSRGFTTPGWVATDMIPSCVVVPSSGRVEVVSATNARPALVLAQTVAAGPGGACPLSCP